MEANVVCLSWLRRKNADSGAPGGLVEVEKAQSMFVFTSKMMACGRVVCANG